MQRVKNETQPSDKPSLADWERQAVKDAHSTDASALVRETPEGIPIKCLYTAQDLADVPSVDSLPGFAPFLRGPRPAALD